jgi:hypothetical protein
MGLKALGADGYDINFPRLYVKCWVGYPKHRQTTRVAAKHWLAGRSPLYLLPGMAWGLLMELCHFASRVWFRFVLKPQAYGPLDQIGAAYRELERRIPPWRPPEGGRARG